MRHRHDPRLPDCDDGAAPTPTGTTRRRIHSRVGDVLGWVMRSVVAAAMLSASACTATPLPTPPTVSADVGRIEVEMDPGGGVIIRGGEDAVTPPGTAIRLTLPPPMTGTGVPDIAETVTNSDGSFMVNLPGSATSVFYLEALLTDADVFLLAFTAGIGDGTVAVDSLPDLDMDGSPDEIDCAPDDDTYQGQRCP